MAARKTSSKKTKAQKPVEDVVIEGVAEEINPADSASVKAKAKPVPPKSEHKNGTPKDDGQKNKSSFVMMISLAALLAGLTGAGLGGLAYLKMTQKSDPIVENQKIAAMIEEKIAVSLTPIQDDLAKVKTALSAASSRDNTAELKEMIEAIETKFSTLQSSLHVHDSEGLTGYNHHHEDNVDRVRFEAALGQINAEITALKIAANPKPKPQPEPAETSSKNNQDHADEGWWGNVLNAFSITRVDAPDKTEGE